MKRHPRTRSGSRRRTADDPALSMNSLMDIMTIILCFLLHSYGDSPIVVNATFRANRASSAWRVSQLASATGSKVRPGTARPASSYC